MKTFPVEIILGHALNLSEKYTHSAIHLGNSCTSVNALSQDIMPHTLKWFSGLSQTFQIAPKDINF